MLMLFQIAMTILIVWFMSGLVGLIFRTNGIKPNLLMGLAVFFTAALVGYMWDVAHIIY